MIEIGGGTGFGQNGLGELGAIHQLGDAEP
jgi:hypothetical protein